MLDYGLVWERPASTDEDVADGYALYNLSPGFQSALLYAADLLGLEPDDDEPDEADATPIAA